VSSPYGQQSYGRPQPYDQQQYGQPRYGQQPYPQQSYAYGRPYYGPQPYGMPVHGLAGRPSSHLGWAIGCIFLFWPLAIPAIVNATKVDTAWLYGHAAEAQLRAEKARTFCVIATAVGAFVWLLNIFLFVLLPIM
jgi:Interferon-induced transmembrane protein